MRIKLLLLLMFICNESIYSQTYETRIKVYIPKGRVVTKVETATGCPEIVKKNSVIESKYFRTKGEIKVTITNLDTLTEDKERKYDKKQTIKLKDFSGWVSIKEDKKDKSQLHINPWLSKRKKIDSGLIVERIKRVIDCSGVYKDTILSKDTLKKIEYYRYVQIPIEGKNLKERMKNDSLINSTDWFKSSKDLLKVYSPEGVPRYYLVNKYDRNADYFLKLENREFLSLARQSFVFGPITIPFKYRLAHEKNQTNIDSEFSADFNVGIFAGKNWGRYRVRYESKELKKLSNLSRTIGGFVSLSRTVLDSSSTTGAEKPIEEGDTKAIATISPGIGAMLSIYNFNFGFFAGVDIGFGSSAGKWDHNNRPWLGVGIGYNLTNGFFKDK